MKTQKVQSDLAQERGGVWWVKDKHADMAAPKGLQKISEVNEISVTLIILVIV